MLGGRTICLARNEQGAIFAINDECTHEKYSLSEGELIGNEIECPQHSSRFDLFNGKPTGLPAMIPVEVFATVIEGDDVFVDL
jgi:3-phenylpropionate/trans-cinnamate dioxygenase ferredoxin subunit